MKQIVAIVFGVIISFGSWAQVELEHTFHAKLDVKYFNVENNLFYYYFDENDSELVVLNNDYSVYRQVAIDMPEGYEYDNIYYPSDKLFNTDSSIEFLMVLISIVYDAEIGGSRVNHSMILYNESGEKLFDFGNSYRADLHKDGSRSKLLILRNGNDAGRQVYSLPGTVTNTNARVLPVSSNPAYPNPSTTIVNLPYKLEPGSSSLMSIYSAGGSLIDQKQLDANIDRIMLDVSNYQPGVYMYEYNGVTNRFVVN